jgi:neutral amino acid transport system permease protein
MDWGLILENGLKALVGADAIVYALAAIGLNVQFGYTGLINFGQAAFVAVGAFGVGMGVVTYGWPLWVSVIVGLVAAVVLALVLGLPTLRLRADYLAIVTIAASEILRLCLRSRAFDDWTGGSDGRDSFAGSFRDLNPLPTDGWGLGPIHLGQGNEYGFWVVSFTSSQTWVLLVGWGLVALTSLAVYLLMRSPWGRVVKSIREDEDAVRSLGKNVNWYKMQALILGGVIGALGGIVYALSRNAVTADRFATLFTFFAYTALILGGTARVKGPIVGAMIFWSLLSFTDIILRQATEADYISSDILSGTEIGITRFLLVGLGLVLLMVFRPQGIFGDKNEVAIGERG